MCLCLIMAQKSALNLTSFCLEIQSSKLSCRVIGHIVVIITHDTAKPGDKTNRD